MHALLVARPSLGDRPTSNHLQRLPPELKCRVATHLDAGDLMRLLRVDRMMRDVVLANEKFLTQRICAQQSDRVRILMAVTLGERETRSW